MPGQGTSSGRSDQVQQPYACKRLYAVDATTTPASAVTDIRALTGVAVDAVGTGRGHVLRTDYVVFPNGAVTLVLILAESHLSIHTWPEENMIAIDLFSCGAIDGERVISSLTRDLALADVRVERLERGACQA